MSTISYSRRNIFLASQIVGASLLCWPAGTRAQAPAGPLPAAQSQAPASSQDVQRQQQTAPVKPRTSIMGAWKFNRDESDDARQKMQEARGAGGGGGGRAGGGGGGVRLGIPGMGGGPYGGRRGGGGGGENENDADREKMQEALNPSRGLTLAEAAKNVEVDVFDDQQRKTAIYTDGRKLQKTKDSNNQEVWRIGTAIAW